MKSSQPIQTILVVEDDPTYLQLWNRLIKDLKVQNFWTASDAQKAIKILKEKKIDLLISDIVLPFKNGYEIAKLAKEQNPDVRILLTTGYGTDLSRFDLERSVP